MLQTDPSGYGDGVNFYSYVKADPVNGTDPLGLLDVDPTRNLIDRGGGGDIIVYGGGHFYNSTNKSNNLFGNIGSSVGGGLEGSIGGGASSDIVVTANKPKNRKNPDVIIAKPQSGNLETRCYAKATDRMYGPPQPFEYDPQTQLAQSAAAFGKHFPGSGKSAFGGDINTPVALFNALNEITPGSIAVPAGFGGRAGRTVRITGATGMVTGTDAISGMQTQYLTAFYQITGRKTEAGLNEAVLVTAYPGCPR